MKIAFYIGSISFGGAERVITNLANRFNENGDEVILITTYKRKEEYSVNRSIKRENLLSKETENWVSRNFKCINRLRRIVKQNKIDVLVSFLKEPNFRSLISCIGIKTKNIISVRNDPDKEYSNWVEKYFVKVIYSLADGVVFQTKYASDWFPKRIIKKSRIIFNQVDDLFFKTLKDDSCKDIMTFGRLFEQKNHEMLIRAYARVQGQIQDNLIIYGEGPLREKLEHLIDSMGLSHRIMLPGAVTNVPEILKSAKVFILSSDYEGMPNALLEAMAVGLPCISTDCPCGGPKTVIENNVNGLLVPVGNETLLAESLLSLISDEKKRQSIGAKARETAKCFESNKVFSEWNDFIRSVIR